MSLERMRGFLQRAERLFVITGAGCSAPSGIETYRDHQGDWQRPAPVQHQDFLGHPEMRQRYWARSLRGWPMFDRARPNAAHRALADLETSGRVCSLVTQNVDGLHQKAGQRELVELHGSLATVVCLTCGARTDRSALQRRLEADNPTLLDTRVSYAPDGDANIEETFDYGSVRVPECDCGGLLKPDVVFYGDSVPRGRVEEARRALARSDALLVVGSSLMVFSSYRFLRQARELGLPMAAVNLGRTRADDWLDAKLEADCALALPDLVDSL